MILTIETQIEYIFNYCFESFKLFLNNYLTCNNVVILVAIPNSTLQELLHQTPKNENNTAMKAIQTETIA